LAKKMSCVQTGYFMSSYKLATGAYFNKVSNVSLPLALLRKLTARRRQMAGFR